MPRAAAQWFCGLLGRTLASCHRPSRGRPPTRSEQGLPVDGAVLGAERHGLGQLDGRCVLAAVQLVPVGRVMQRAVERGAVLQVFVVALEDHGPRGDEDRYGVLALDNEYVAVVDLVVGLGGVVCLAGGVEAVDLRHGVSSLDNPSSAPGKQPRPTRRRFHPPRPRSPRPPVEARGWSAAPRGPGPSQALGLALARPLAGGSACPRPSRRGERFGRIGRWTWKARYTRP